MRFRGKLLLMVATVLLLLSVPGRVMPGQPTYNVISIVAPNALANVDGNSYETYPFDGYIYSMRYQQVFDASQFAAIADGGGYIQLIALRADGACRSGIGQSISNLQMSLSTTARGPDSLSPVFAENVGMDQTIVFGPGPSRLQAICTLEEPDPWSVIFPFASPFYYHPTNGNLLLDIRNFSGSSSDGFLLQLDGHDVADDSISSLFAFGATSETASLVSSFGYVVLFEIRPTPRLHLALTLTNLLFRWVNYPGNWALQCTTVLGTGMIWQPAGGIMTTNAGYREVTLPLDTNSTSGFYRLVLPPLGSSAADVETVVVPAVNSKQEY